MASPSRESKTLHSYLDIEEEVDYGSDTSVQGDSGTMSDVAPAEVHPRTPLNPFTERSDAHAPMAQHPTNHPDDMIITNPLDEQQQMILHREESARRQTEMATALERRRDYVFTPLSVEERLRQVTGQTLATWVIGPEATSPEEIANRQVLR